MSDPIVAAPRGSGRPSALPTPLEPGDFVPRLILPDTGGESITLTHQSIAGGLVVLLFPQPNAELAPWVAAAEALRSIGGRMFAVTTSAFASPPAPLTGLIDTQNVARPAFGIDGAGAAIIDPAGRFAARLVGEAASPAAVESLCRQLHAQTTPHIIAAQAPVLVLPQAIAPALCERLMAYWEAGEKLSAQVSRGGDRAAYDTGIKQREDVLLKDEALLAELRRAMAWCVRPAMRRAFNWEPTEFEAFRVGCYPAEKGFFRRHRDNTTPNTDHRVFAMSINLNQDFAGGELVFPEFGRMCYRPPAGGAVIFSCSLLHEALDVTAGRRFGLFNFLYDSVGVAKIAARLASQRAQRDAGS
ncbi:MAG: 2OG-Fe(II) oxygenase [Alphaproteobacteria bacterium]|nr:2OG-Fe(II) oxygenase [Alphaproteobacteria bacterium]